MILKPNLNLNQTTHLKNLNATAWVHKYVSTLIFDFKFIKIILILNLHAHKNIQKSYFSYSSSFQNFRVLHSESG
jgi:hypothetical protein